MGCWNRSHLNHGLLCRCCVNCWKSCIPAHQGPENEESTALFHFTPCKLKYRECLCCKMKVPPPAQLLPSWCWGAVWATFVLVSALLCATDSGVVPTSVRHPQITRCSLSAGGWSTTQADLSCFTVTLICSQPKTAPRNAINWTAASGNHTFLHFPRR